MRLVLLLTIAVATAIWIIGLEKWRVLISPLINYGGASQAITLYSLPKQDRRSFDHIASEAIIFDSGYIHPEGFYEYKRKRR